jgi:hypothetical protein
MKRAKTGARKGNNTSAIQLSKLITTLFWFMNQNYIRQMRAELCK